MRHENRHFIVVALMALLVLGGSVRSEPEDHGTNPTTGPRVNPKASGDRGNGRCPTTAQNLTDFANGESYNFPPIVSFLTAPECQDVARLLSAQAISKGVNFKSEGPFALEQYAKAVTAPDASSLARLDAQLAQKIPTLLNDNSLSARDMAPLIGQLALLSPTASRGALVNLIDLEIRGADETLGLSDLSRTPNPKQVAQLAAYMSRLGTGEPIIATGLAATVTDRALRAQFNSLASYFRALGVLSTVDPNLAQTFNLSAGAFSRGVQKGKSIYSPSDRDGLLFSLFMASRAAVFGSELLEPAASELNEAISAMMAGKNLQVTSLRKIWREVVKLLGLSTTQLALADAFALSLTPDLVFLSQKDMHGMVLAATNYPQVALAIQAQSLRAWNQIYDDHDAGKMNDKKLKELRTQYIDPLVKEILEFGFEWINPVWLRTIASLGIITDDQIEKKFPKLVLSYLEKRDKAAIRSLASTESPITLYAQDLAQGWALSTVHIPILRAWVKRHEAAQDQ